MLPLVVPIVFPPLLLLPPAFILVEGPFVVLGEGTLELDPAAEEPVETAAVPGIAND